MLKKKTNAYYQGVRDDIIELVKNDVQRVLDVGCGFGMTGERLKIKGVSEVVGIEVNQDAYYEAKRRLDRVFLEMPRH